LPKLIADGIRNRGFSVVEVITGCPTYYGRMNEKADPKKLLEWQRDHAVNLKQFEMLSSEEKQGKLAIGVLHSAPRPEYTDEYLKLINRVQEQ
jgi:2-oxoglutarate ferredoxin oxidoreductase subunit beta